jgi:hypothetical protein
MPTWDDKGGNAPAEANHSWIQQRLGESYYAAPVMQLIVRSSYLLYSFFANPWFPTSAQKSGAKILPVMRGK